MSEFPKLAEGEEVVTPWEALAAIRHEVVSAAERIEKGIEANRRGELKGGLEDAERAMKRLWQVYYCLPLHNQLGQRRW